MNDDTKRLATEVQAPEGSATPESTTGHDGVEGLVGLLKDLKPYLDSFGRAYCGGLGRDAKGRGGWPLDSEPVVSLLTYRYLDRFKTTPPKSAMDLARMIVIGGLWEGRKPHVGNEAGSAVVVKVILKMANEGGDFLGSATDGEMALREFVKKHPDCLKPGETLPDGPDKLGIILNQIGVVLLDQGVELFRPQRKDVKRLWAWRKLRPANDTADTHDAEQSKVSGVASSNNTKTTGNTDATDGFTPSERLLMSTFRGDHDDDRSAA